MFDVCILQTLDTIHSSITSYIAKLSVDLNFIIFSMHSSELEGLLEPGRGNLEGKSLHVAALCLGMGWKVVDQLETKKHKKRKKTVSAVIFQTSRILTFSISRI